MFVFFVLNFWFSVLCDLHLHFCYSFFFVAGFWLLGGFGVFGVFVVFRFFRFVSFFFFFFRFVR